MMPVMLERRLCRPPDENARITIDAEFEAMQLPLTKAEQAGLFSSLVLLGCLDPLIVWQEENILVAGHNRYHRCWQELPVR